MNRRVAPFLFSFLASAASVLSGMSCTRSAEPLPVLSTLPSFSLRAADGSLRGSDDLKGGVWIADFIFTQCPGVCPALSARMAQLQGLLEREGMTDIRLVSFSVDPAHDTPQALQAYGRRYGADARRWWLLTGEREALHRLIGEGFLLAVAERSPEAGGAPQELITHSDRFVLVDADLHVRGYYRPLEEQGLAPLLEDLRRLRATPR